ncbi:hypothetical protein COO60DRAFT_517220 [Scenedesmus sp. NREL 46B-D3]|nr:hypothetical protein COO60DRAFT_517220 [Scenedesmus sp. NREL 46B-D3]
MGGVCCCVCPDNVLLPFKRRFLLDRCHRSLHVRIDGAVCDGGVSLTKAFWQSCRQRFFIHPADQSGKVAFSSSLCSAAQLLSCHLTGVKPYSALLRTHSCHSFVLRGSDGTFTKRHRYVRQLLTSSTQYTIADLLADQHHQRVQIVYFTAHVWAVWFYLPCWMMSLNYS